jgi:hypothetical protein
MCPVPALVGVASICLGFRKSPAETTLVDCMAHPTCYARFPMIVSKATSVYVIMVVILIGGLWLILAIGSTLMPPTDLAGKWELKGASGTQDLSVEQSGKFVNLVMGSWASSLKVKHDGNQNPIGNQSPAQQNSIVLTGNGESVTFTNLGIDDDCTIRFKGAVTGEYHAHRTARAFH